MGRFDTAAAILRTYAGFVDRGMLPNRFSDAGETLEYNTADATLWMFHALSEHLEAKRDPDLQRDLFPTLAAIIHAHVDGTRYGIKVRSRRWIAARGRTGVQLTWMDAKHGDHVFTPRIGKPVEINALWLNALEVAIRLAGRVRNTAEKRFCQGLLKQASDSFARFWNADTGCLYDVLDGVDGKPDASIRPNQILAVSLPYCVLTEAPDARRGRHLRPRIADQLWASLLEPRCAGVCGSLHRQLVATRCGLPPGDGMELVARSVRARPSPRVWRCRPSSGPARAHRPTSRERLRGVGQRDI